MPDAAQVAVVKTETSTTAGGITQRASTIVAQGRVRWNAIPEQRRPWLIAGVSLIAAVIAGLFWFAARPDWRVLFSGLESKDTQQVSQELAAAGIPYQMTADNSGIEVPAEQLDKARMEVATKGMPQSGRLGFELFDKPNWVGSEFDEHVNYQRALEGELEHTIATLGVVRSARVHLAMPQQSLFAQDQKPAKASVILRLKRASLPVEQADSIRNLVAGAIENLSPEQVTLVDADGRVNLQSHSRNATQAEAEQALEAKLIAMLEPLAGQGNIRASVNIAYDETGEERTDEVYDPNLTVPVTSQKTERSSSGAQRSASGVPGTASNSPAPSAQGAVAGSEAAAAPGTPPLLQKTPLPVYPQATPSTQNEKQESGTYAVSKHTTHSESGPNRMRRVSAAVVVNDREILDPAAKTKAWRPRSMEEMHRFEELAQAAVGFDGKRGDQVVMENISFNSNVPEEKATLFERLVEAARAMLHAPPATMRTAVVGLLGVLLVLFVLRPLAGQVVRTLQEPMLLGAGAPAAHSVPDWTDLADQISASIPAAVPQKAMAPPRDSLYMNLLEHIRREPAQSTRVLEAWIGDSGEAS